MGMATFESLSREYRERRNDTLWRATTPDTTSIRSKLPPDHLLLDSAPNIGPLISCWELDKFKNC